MSSLLKSDLIVLLGTQQAVVIYSTALIRVVPISILRSIGIGQLHVYGADI